MEQQYEYYDFPPEVAASYMKKYPNYFDMRKHKKKFTRRPNSSTLMRHPLYYSHKANQHKNYFIGRINYNNYSVYDRNKLDELMESDRNKFKPPYPKVSKQVKRFPQLSQEEIFSILKKMKFPIAPNDPYDVKRYLCDENVREMIENEYMRIVEEEKGFSPGTYYISEDDRILILKNLEIIRNDLIEQLKLFPVDFFLRSIGIIEKRRLLEKRLEEVEYAIKVFQFSDVRLQM